MEVADHDDSEDDLQNISHPMVMIANGLQLEDDQRRLADNIDALGQHATSKQLATLAERSNQLRRKISAWTDEQSIYMPSAAQQRLRNQRSDYEGVAAIKTQDILLWLPSKFKDTDAVTGDLCMYEWKLREGQAYDALEEIRHVLRLRSHLFKHKDRFARGVHHNTRSNVVIANADARIN
ncbi:hypothetical protein Hypma_013763 [Hypsizygus marmoreus]|uniref:Uncharacterized protein n=1 Tax=Hypsizygus marmoreus TaxID=39966 RepID=A0A369KAS7_HYPMA|nr:hypothetical protein Hypma_013763 [Hypsizygus marmoreus]